MPNIVYNRMVVEGNPDDIRVFKKRHFVGRTGHKEFDFDTVIPLGDSPQLNEVIYAWGTKWNSWDLEWVNRFEDRPAFGPGVDQLDFRFKTAWAAPEPIFVTLMEMYPDLSFVIQSVDEFMEDGEKFVGYTDDKTNKAEYYKEAVTLVDPEFYEEVTGMKPSQEQLEMYEVERKALEEEGDPTPWIVGGCLVGVVAASWYLNKARNK